MNDILDAVSARIKSPYFGYSVLAFIAFNWRSIFLLSTTEGTPQERLAAFDAETSALTLVIFPLLVGAFVAATTPWIRYGFGLISRKPLALIDNIHLESEHTKTIRKTELEQSRSELFASREIELIGRAKRDEQVLEIGDDKVKERLRSELEALRLERDKLSQMNELTEAEIELLKAASKSRNGSISKIQQLSGRQIQAGGVTFGEEGQREFLKYAAALNALHTKELVQDVNNRGELFELTHIGWEVADAL